VDELGVPDGALVADVPVPPSPAFAGTAATAVRPATAASAIPALILLRP